MQTEEKVSVILSFLGGPKTPRWALAGGRSTPYTSLNIMVEQRLLLQNKSTTGNFRQGRPPSSSLPLPQRQLTPPPSPLGGHTIFAQMICFPRQLVVLPLGSRKYTSMMIMMMVVVPTSTNLRKQKGSLRNVRNAKVFLRSYFRIPRDPNWWTHDDGPGGRVGSFPGY